MGPFSAWIKAAQKDLEEVAVDELTPPNVAKQKELAVEIEKLFE
jgi:hypothetical protein